MKNIKLITQPSRACNIKNKISLTIFHCKEPHKQYNKKGSDKSREPWSSGTTGAAEDLVLRHISSICKFGHVARDHQEKVWLVHYIPYCSEEKDIKSASKLMPQIVLATPILKIWRFYIFHTQYLSSRHIINYSVSRLMSIMISIPLIQTYFIL